MIESLAYGYWFGQVAMKTMEAATSDGTRFLRMYYAATLLFVILDYLLNINVRLAFLEAWPGMRALYYLLCFVCLGLMTWRPGWSPWIGTLESALALSLLILTMGVRVTSVSEQMLDGGTGLVTVSEIMNFMIVGGAAWLAYTRGMVDLRRRSGGGW